MTTTVKDLPKQKKRIVKTYDFKVLTRNTPDSTRTITLFGRNGKPQNEEVPKKYWNNETKIKEYLKQRVNGIIKKGGIFFF